jgi:L-threonylcarbamoyladenylate synthase
MHKLSHFKLKLIKHHIQTGGLIAYPTEAVFGLGCDPNNKHAVKSLLALKSRSPSKGLIVIASDLQQLTPFLQPLTTEIIDKLDQTWPGPITWLLPADPATPKWLTGTHSTLACRVSSHPIVRQLCSAFGGALVSTSANRSNRPPCRTVVQVRKQFNHTSEILIVSGTTGNLKQPTPILDAAKDSRLR